MPNRTELHIVSADVIGKSEVAVSLSNGATFVLSAEQLVEDTLVEADGTEGEDPIEV